MTERRLLLWAAAIALSTRDTVCHPPESAKGLASALRRQADGPLPSSAWPNRGARPRGGAGGRATSRAGSLQLRGGIGEAMGGLESERADIARDVEGNEFRSFGEGPGHCDISGSKFETRPTGLFQEDTLMDGIGGILWDYPEGYRLIGEHVAGRVGHRVRASPYLKAFWGRFNFTDFEDGWDHQSDRLGTIVGISSTGDMCEVLWDEEGEHPESSDWYATGYLTHYYLSLAEDAIQPEWPDRELEKLREMEAQVERMRHQYAKTGTVEPQGAAARILEDSDAYYSDNDEDTMVAPCGSRATGEPLDDPDSDDEDE